MPLKRMITDFLISTLIFAFICANAMILKIILYKNDELYESAVIITKPIDIKYYGNFKDSNELFDAITKRSLGEVTAADVSFGADSFTLTLTVSGARRSKGSALIYSGIYTECESFFVRGAKRGGAQR